LYSTPDSHLKANNNFGDVIEKNVLLFKPTTEGIASCQSIKKDTIWIVTHEYNNNKFRIYKITKFGLDTIPLINEIGGIHSDYVTYMSFSPDGRKLAVFNYGGVSEVFDFNSGILFNRVSLPDGGYGACFSPDNSKLYFTRDGTTIVQFSLCNNNVAGSLKIYYDIYADNSTYGAISNTTDTSLLIISSIGKDSLSIIKNANSTLNDNNIKRFNISLLGRFSGLGLPNFIQNYFYYNLESCKEGYIEHKQNQLTIPNIFTPNGDDVNDYFIIQLAGYKYLAYTIYNRWGMLISQCEREIDPESNKEIKLWDGTYEGHKVSSGIYYYRIVLTKMNDEQEIKTGYIHVMY